MYNNMKWIWKCLFSPRLYKVYKDGPRESAYQAEGLEKIGDKIISVASLAFNIGIYTSPLICFYLYRRGYFSSDESKTFMHLFGGIGCILAVTVFMRALGRSRSPKYMEFMKALTDQTPDKNIYMDGIRKFDFEFYAWPVTYGLNPTEQSSWLSYIPNPFAYCANVDLPIYKKIPVQIMAFIAVHTFAIRLIYPGSLSLLQNLLGSAILQGRSQLVESFGGKRAKIKAADGNIIDTMYVKNQASSKGDTLVVCCEGNSGFYEVGIMLTPIKTGYSVLGWNHPGFAGSSGTPFPVAEVHAIDVVMQYAINELGYQPDQIVLFGWSIGGYTATWAAITYPDVHSLILDATFDDLLPLALNQMPSSWALLVKEVVRSYVDLNIAAMLTDYEGPVKLVRRTEDEIISLTPGKLATNRANFLLIRLVEARHSEVSDEVFALMERVVVLVDVQRDSLLRTDSEQMREPLTLISKYMWDYKSTHCTPLPEEQFKAIMKSVELQRTNEQPI